MGCPQFGIINKTITFTLQVNDGNGVAADADSLPTYKVYEDDTDTAIATGTMAKRNDTGTTGHYAKKLTLTTANGYENYKSYHVRISFVLNSTTYVTPYDFNILGTFLSAETVTEGDGLSLTELKDICIYHGWSDTKTAGLTQLKHFINQTFYMLHDLVFWPEFIRIDGSHTFDAADDQETLDEANIAQVGSVITTNRYTPLTEIALEEWLLLKRSYGNSGTPDRYAVRRYSSSGTVVIDMYLYPAPSAETVVYYSSRIGANELVNDSDQTTWPSSRSWLLTDALRTRLAATNRDVTGAALYGSDFMAKVYRSLGSSRASLKPIVINEPIARSSLSIKDIPMTVQS